MADTETTAGVTPPPPSPTPNADTWAAAWPYVVPMVGFLVLTSLEGQLPSGPKGVPSAFWYPAGYALKVAVVAVLVWSSRAAWRDLAPRPSPATLALSAVVGIAVIVMWVGLDGRYPTLGMLGKRIAFDPATLSPPARVSFLLARFFGLVVLVPLVEELFYRSFLMRWVIDADFLRVPIGKVTPAALAASTAVFGLSHPEWLPALLTGLAWGWLVWQTKSVSACVVSHAVANLALGIYVMATGEWKYW